LLLLLTAANGANALMILLGDPVFKKGLPLLESDEIRFRAGGGSTPAPKQKKNRQGLQYFKQLRRGIALAT
jgi:hypothetical protein